MGDKIKITAIVGPTASGKSGLALELARREGGCIVSCDSMQIYRGMDIGSAKIRPEEMRGVPHHLINIREPEEAFSVADFVEEARRAAEGIYARGHLPILVGGTGFYIQALLKDVDFNEEAVDGDYRAMLQRLAEAENGGAA